MKKIFTLISVLFIFANVASASIFEKNVVFQMNDSFAQALNKANDLGYKSNYVIIEGKEKGIKQIKFDKSVKFENLKMEASFLSFYNDSLSIFIYYLNDKNFRKIIDRYKTLFGNPTPDNNRLVWFFTNGVQIIATPNDVESGYNTLTKMSASAVTRSQRAQGLIKDTPEDEPIDTLPKYCKKQIIGFCDYLFGSSENRVDSIARLNISDYSEISGAKTPNSSTIVAFNCFACNFTFEQIIFVFDDNKLESLRLSIKDKSDYTAIVSILIDNYGPPQKISEVNGAWEDKQGASIIITHEDNDYKIYYSSSIYNKKLNDTNSKF